MVFFANRANLDRRRLLRRLHDVLATQADAAETPVEQVRYHPSAANRAGVHADVDPDRFVGSDYPADATELQVSFDFPPEADFDVYTIQWVEPERSFAIGFHQDETHPELGECHLQVDFGGETIERRTVEFVDAHPLNVFDRRTDELVEVLRAITWDGGVPGLPGGIDV